MTATVSAKTASSAKAAAPPASDRTARLKIGFLSLYGSGAIVDSGSAVLLNSFLYFYLTAVCGLSGSLTGFALALALVVDSVVDPLVGSLSDNATSRSGRRHPFMFFAGVPIALALGLLFSIPAGISGVTLFAYVVACTLALRIGLSAFNVPYVALGAEMSDDYHERSVIVAFRVAIGTVGTLAATVLGYGVFLSTKSGGLLHRAAYAPYAWTIAVLVAVTALLASFGTLGVRARLHGANPGAGSALTQVLREMGEVFRNRSFVTLFSACLIFFIAQGVAGALTQHANNFFWKMKPEQILLVSVSIVPGVLLGIVITGLLTRVVEKRTIAMGGLLAIGLCQLLPVTLALNHIVPMTSAVPLLVVAIFIAGIGATMALVGFQSMMADAADEHELLFSARREGLYFAGISFSVKASSGIGVLIAGVAADAIGFPNDLAAKGAALRIPVETAHKLGIIYGPGAAMISTIAVLVLLAYRIDRKAHTQILETLSARRQITQVPGALA